LIDKNNEIVKSNIEFEFELFYLSLWIFNCYYHASKILNNTQA